MWRSWYSRSDGGRITCFNGAFDLVGNTLSGWLSDRFDSRMFSENKVLDRENKVVDWRCVIKLTGSRAWWKFVLGLRLF
ncbi:hypothetical protein [Paenibacillus sp. SYP-B3998]|uniref:hypothetical protein n=1 Tax=Paenibacillus sp. SYP-B3998 TaxID=2678564 RepID=UPI001F084FCD|nr:hypothetical protein [Paenibacillus sp. SYP-B3998]